METIIKQAVCESRNSEKVVKFLTENELSEEIVKAIDNGNIWGVYYNENDELVAEDVWGAIHTNILKPERKSRHVK